MAADIQRAETGPQDHEHRNALELISVTKVFDGRDGRVQALHDVSLDVRHGEFVAILGSSGCGKTTLVRLVAGLTDVTAGEVRVEGKKVDGPPSNTGLMFQAPVLLPWRSVLRNVLLPIEFLGHPVSSFEDKAIELLDLVGLKDFAKAFPHELSGGMQQRVALVRTLLYDPDVLLLDEPFGALDALTREDLNIELERIWERDRKTAVLITHSVSEAIFLADRVVIMSKRPGTITEIVPIGLDRPRSRETKYTKEFLEFEKLVSTRLMAEVG